jgi:hypothetical protein
VGVQRAGRDRQIVGITAATREQRWVFLAKNGFAELPGHIPASAPCPSLYMRVRILSARVLARSAVLN